MRESIIALWLMRAYIITTCIVGIICLWYFGLGLYLRIRTYRKENKEYER